MPNSFVSNYTHLCCSQDVCQLTGSSSLLDLCLRLGADIKQATPAVMKYSTKGVYRSKGYGFISKLHCKVVKVTPLHVYPLSLPWLSPADMPEPRAGIEYLSSRGVQLSPSGMETVCPSMFDFMADLYAEFNGHIYAVSAAELLLEAGPTTAMGHRTFLNTVHFLVNNGCDLSKNPSARSSYRQRQEKAEVMSLLYHAMRQRPYSTAREILRH